MAATSAESGRTTASSPDIDWQIVWQRVGMGLTFPEIAARLHIYSLGSAHRLYTRLPKQVKLLQSDQKYDQICVN